MAGISGWPGWEFVVATGVGADSIEVSGLTEGRVVWGCGVTAVPSGVWVEAVGASGGDATAVSIFLDGAASRDGVSGSLAEVDLPNRLAIAWLTSEEG